MVGRAALGNQVEDEVGAAFGELVEEGFPGWILHASYPSRVGLFDFEIADDQARVDCYVRGDGVVSPDVYPGVAGAPG